MQIVNNFTEVGIPWLSSQIEITNFFGYLKTEPMRILTLTTETINAMKVAGDGQDDESYNTIVLDNPAPVQIPKSTEAKKYVKLPGPKRMVSSFVSKMRSGFSKIKNSSARHKEEKTDLYREDISDKSSVVNAPLSKKEKVQSITIWDDTSTSCHYYLLWHHIRIL